MAQGFMKLPGKAGVKKGAGKAAGKAAGKKAPVAPRKRAAQLQHAVQKRLTSAIHRKIEESVIQRAGGLRIISGEKKQ